MFETIVRTRRKRNRWSRCGLALAHRQARFYCPHLLHDALRIAKPARRLADLDYSEPGRHECWLKLHG